MNEVVSHPGNLPLDVKWQSLAGHDLSLRYALGIVQSKWRLMAGIALLTFLVTAGAILLMPHSYYAQALVIIHPVADNPAQPVNEQTVLPPDTSAIDTEVEVLRSPAVTEGVIRKLKLYQDPEFGGTPGIRPTDRSIHEVLHAVMGRSDIRRIGLTYAVQVGFTAGELAKARQIADGIVDAYLARKLDEKLAAVTQANRDLGATLGGLRRQALEAESRLEKYKVQNNLLGSDATASTETELTTLDQQVSEARADAAEKQAKVAAAMRRAADAAGGSDVGSTLASNTIGALRQKEAEVAAQLSQLQTEFQPDYPLVKKAQAELGNIQHQIQTETARIIASLKADATVAAQKQASLMASRGATEARLAANNKAKVGLLTLQQAADSAKKIYETYLTRASEVAVARSLQRVDAMEESKAVPGPTSVFARPRVILAIAGLLAALGGLIAIVLSEMWSPKVRSCNDVARETGLPLAGILPAVRIGKQDPANHLAANPLTAFAEALRNLRAFLMLSQNGAVAKIIAVTSAVPGEGKTLVSTCLARTLAATGAKVVLVDCDLRRAGQKRDGQHSTYGSAEVLMHSAAIDDALYYDPDNNLWHLSGQSADHRAADLFNADRVGGLLEALSQRFDHVVIDTPPLLGFADGRIVASKSDRVLFVVKWNGTTAPTVRAAVEVLRQCGAPVSGVVLNEVNVRQQARFGFGDGSDYYHYYGSAYAPPA